MNEAPQVAPHMYWLTNDNALAAYTFSQLGQLNLSDQLKTSLRRYGAETNGLIEVIWGMPVTYPPYAPRPVLVYTIGIDEVWQEFHDREPLMEDWAEYANLGFLGVLNAYHRGQSDEALSRFSKTLVLYDGTGFRDKAFADLYETYKLAMALYTGAIIGVDITAGDQLLDTMLAMQTDEGGFRTHFRSVDKPEGDANTETTAMALLALKAYGCREN